MRLRSIIIVSAIMLLGFATTTDIPKNKLAPKKTNTATIKFYTPQQISSYEPKPLQPPIPKDPKDVYNPAINMKAILPEETRIPKYKETEEE